jgi:hypothetical protein
MSKPLVAAVIITLAALPASVWWLERSERSEANTSAQAMPQRSSAELTRTRAAAPPRSAAPAVVAESSWDPQLVKRMEHKYRYLFTDARLPPERIAQLRELLLEYEQTRAMAGSPDDPELQLDAVERGRIERALAELEARIRALLGPAQYASYESLRASDVEQEHLTQYSGGVSNFAPLTPAQERVILEARLRHKKRYEAGLHEFGLDRQTLSVEERNYAHRNAARTLEEYRDNFLAEVRPALSEEQYFLLSSYETTEFQRELQRLQMLINSK